MLRVVQRFRRLLLQEGGGLWAEPDAIFFDDCQRVLTGGWVRAGGAGGDHVQRIAEDIAQDDIVYLRRGTKLRESSALDGRKPLPHRVHFHDVGAGSQQLIRDILQLRSRDQRAFKKSAAAAGEEKEHRIALAQG